MPSPSPRVFGAGLRGLRFVMPSSSPSSLHRRHIVTASVAPPLPPSRSQTAAGAAAPVYMERPETIVLAEGSLHPFRNIEAANVKHPAEDNQITASSSWAKSFESFFPGRGLHFASVDIATAHRDDDDEPPSLQSLNDNMSRDLAHCGSMASSSSAHVVLVARGPVPSLLAQYYLESLPLAGLVLVDPMLLPPTAAAEEAGDEKCQLQSSAEALLSALDIPVATASSPTVSRRRHECDDGRHTMEVELVRSFADPKPRRSPDDASSRPRPLLLEPNAVPVLVLYSAGCDDPRHENHRRACAERTAEFHGGGAGIDAGADGYGDCGETVSMRQITLTGATFSGGVEREDVDGCNEEKEKIDEIMECIYRWYDEVVT